MSKRLTHNHKVEPMGIIKIFVRLLLVLGIIEKGYSLEPKKIAEYETNVWKAYYAMKAGDTKALEDGKIQFKLWLEQVYFLKDATEVLPLFLNAVSEFGKMPLETPKEKYDEKILPLLQKAFEKIKEISEYSAFDINSLARQELAWWVARRIPAECSPDNVGAIMAKACALFYGGDAKKYEKGANLRAYAARYRDNCQDHFGGIQEEDWQRIQEMLTWSYLKLKDALQ
jgi:hypothetical protein